MLGSALLRRILGEVKGAIMDVYLKGYATMGELRVGLAEYFVFYNGERPHQSLGDQTPDVVHQTAAGGGAMIVDKFGGAAGETPAPLRSTGVSPAAEASAKTQSTTKANAKPGQRRPAANGVAGQLKQSVLLS